MIKIAFYLVYIQWRKFFVRGDYFSFGILLVALFLSLYAIYQHYTDYYLLLFLFPTSTLFQHFGRSDFSLLKGRDNFRAIIFLEYLISNLPVLLLFSYKEDFLYAIFCLIFLAILIFLPQKSPKIKYPFVLFDPFWHVSFRKYKLILFVILALLFVFIGKVYENFNLSLFGILLIAFIGIFPYFEREFKIHINTSAYSSKLYLHKQILTGYINFLLILAPTVIFFLVSYKFEISWWILPICFLPLLGVLSRYAYFESILSQTIICIFSIATLQYGLVFFVLPFLYFRALSQLKIRKTDAKN